MAQKIVPSTTQAVVGEGSHYVGFYHPTVGSLTVRTGIDQISWGYGLNTQRYPTYGGEVIQILSAYVDDLTVTGTLQTYMDMEVFYSYFMRYTQAASAMGPRDDRPMTFTYAHRGWSFNIIPTSVPGYRKATDVVAPQYKLVAFVDDSAGDADDLKDLITTEAEMKLALGDSTENFGLEGKIGFIDQNPFSDPNTDFKQNFDPTANIKKIGDYYATLIPAYTKGDFDAVFSGVGSQPAFSATIANKGTTSNDAELRKEIKAAQAKAK